MVFRFHFDFGMMFTSGSFYLYLPYAAQTAFSHPPELRKTSYNFTVHIIYEYPKRYKACKKCSEENYRKMGLYLKLLRQMVKQIASEVETKLLYVSLESNRFKGTVFLPKHSPLNGGSGKPTGLVTNRQ